MKGQMSSDSLRRTPATSLLTLGAFGALALVGCGEDLPSPLIPPADQDTAGSGTVQLSPSSLELAAPGDTDQLTVEVRDAADGLVSDASVSWTSTDSGVATVSADGMVNATGSGEAFVVAAVGAASDSSRVFVGADPGPGDEAGPATAECDSPDPAWIWCDDFEQNRLGEYFEYTDANGSFVREAGAGIDGAYGMRTRFQAGQVSAGSLKLAFGRTPGSSFHPVDAGTADHRDIYWRVYVRLADDWVGGGGDKLSRAMVFARSDWSQAMIGHVWAGSGSNASHLLVDPASGTTSDGTLVTSGYNDFSNLRWLGAARGSTPLFASTGEWHCVEARVRLNSTGASDGVFELWVNDRSDARITGMNWIGSFSDYGLNAVFLENYWNEGSPQTQERYFDRFVVSRERIGC